MNIPPEAVKNPARLRLKPTLPIPHVLNPALVGASLRQAEEAQKPNPGSGQPELVSLLRRITKLLPNVAVRNGVYIKPFQYIVVEDDELANILEKQSYQLGIVENPGDELHETTVKILKKRRCGGQGAKTLLLLEANKSLAGLGLLSGDVWLKDGENVKGIIHPENNQRGSGYEDNQPGNGDGIVGGNNQPGSGHDGGYFNAVGIGLPVYTVNDAPRNCFPAFDPEKYSQPDGEIIVAVLDTGIIMADTDQEGQKTCSDTKTGWSFLDNTPIPNDDHAGRHGTRISWMIHKYCPQAAVIPVKVSNKNNVCELYDVLCGLEYARSIGARIINASWSFTADPGENIPLLEQAIRRLRDANTFVVCAAGNASQYVRDPDGGTPVLGRNQAPKLFPACYTLDNVITVTSVQNQQALLVDKSGRVQIADNLRVFENHSAEFVDIGVVANTGVAADEFAVPVFGPSRGTSFATPVVTGRIAALLLKDQNINKKYELIATLKPEQDTDALGEDIIDSYYIRA